MKRIANEEVYAQNSKKYYKNVCDFLKKVKYFYNRKCILYLIILILILIVNDLILILALNRNPFLIFKFEKKIDGKNEQSNIDSTDEFFMMKTVKEQIKYKNLTKIETISGGYGHVGNALIMLNNLINICEKIKCKNIICPGGLKNIIKKPINDKEYNITIFPNSYIEKINIDILLNKHDIFWFTYKNKPHLMRLKVIREEVLSNIPKYKTDPNDLYINIRSGDVFINRINHMYSQPPLCFYQKIINENNYSEIFILSNGHENPVVDKLLEIYPKIKYIHGTVEYDMSVIINAYNFVKPFSSFPGTLIYLNTNLLKLYIYDMPRSKIERTNYTIFKMVPSSKYSKVMERKWKNSKEQLDLMINENCANNTFEIFLPKKV